MALKAVDDEEEAAKQNKDKHRISNEQLIEQQLAFEDQRYAIKRKALEDERALLEEKEALTIEAQTRLDLALEQLELEYQKNKKERQKQLEAEQPSMERVLDETEQSLQKNFEAVLNKTQTFKEAMKNVWGDMRKAFLNEYIKPVLKQYLTLLKDKLKAALGFGKTELAGQQANKAAQLGAEKAAATASTATNAAAASTNITTNAAEAMSGAFKSTVGIPFIGPIKAPIAAAVALSAVMGMLGRVKSAAGGYDIPRGTNPLTQLHEEEMVLPKPYANVIRDMAGQGGAAGAAGDSGQYHINIQALDARGVRQLFMEHGSAMVASLRAQGRNFAGA